MICSNTVLSGAGSGEYPVGAAGVKELYDTGGTKIVGYGVYLHTKAGITGDTWYWTSVVPLTARRRMTPTAWSPMATAALAQL